MDCNREREKRESVIAIKDKSRHAWLTSSWMDPLSLSRRCFSALLRASRPFLSIENKIRYLFVYCYRAARHASLLLTCSMRTQLWYTFSCVRGLCEKNSNELCHLRLCVNNEESLVVKRRRVVSEAMRVSIVARTSGNCVLMRNRMRGRESRASVFSLVRLPSLGNLMLLISMVGGGTTNNTENM